MTSNYHKVREFHDVFDIPAYDTPTIPDQDRIDLRLRVIAEEFAEVKAELGYAAEDMSLPRLGKELADLCYVAYGTALEFGIDLDAVFEKVHASNMSKLDGNGRPVRREDGKVLKGPYYKEPDMATILEPLPKVEDTYKVLNLQGGPASENTLNFMAKSGWMLQSVTADGSASWSYIFTKDPFWID